MAQKTSPSRRTPSRAPAKKTPAKRTPAKRTAAKKPPARPQVRAVLSPWARDAIGIALVVLGLLSVLAVWFHAAGPGGHAIAWILRGLFGVGAMAFPVAGVYWGVLLLRGTAAEERVRMFIGFAVLVFGSLGLTSLFRGNPGPLSGYHGVHAAGGFIGAVAAAPLSTVLFTIGTAIVCLGVAVLGLLIFTGTSFAAVREALSDLRAARAERDPVAQTAHDAHGRSPRAAGLLASLGLDTATETEPMVVLPDVDPGPDIEDLIEEEPERSPVPARGRTVSTEDGPYHLPPIDLLRTAPPSTADGSDEESV
ncbi:MAG: DNA translocase FtsK 4TM domain-containing protein, partial [Actinomycetota bacterium]